MGNNTSGDSVVDVRDARALFPATTAGLAYFNTAAVGLASRATTSALKRYVNDWSESGLDYVRGEAAAEVARTSVAALIGADRSAIALIASVSAAAGLVAAQLGPAEGGHNVVIGEREYSSNHFPWRLLAGKGYDVRQVPFRNGGLEPDDVAAYVDASTQLIAFSGVQTASGHCSDIPAISALARAVGAVVFVDGSQMVGAMPVADHLEHIDVLATSDHKFLMNAGRGVGYCYLSSAMQDRFVPVTAGWKAGREPFESFFGPAMDLSPTASRFDNSISWLAAIGDEAALSVFETFGSDAIFRRNRELTDMLRSRLTEIGRAPIDLPVANRSTIVSVPLGDDDPSQLLRGLRERGIVCSARDGNLRLAIHFYNHEDDIEKVAVALTEL
ncbi:MAG: aminotransferase class V-fold PLP-dependent enzyme [Actinomycetota bacterium]